MFGICIDLWQIFPPHKNSHEPIWNTHIPVESNSLLLRVSIKEQTRFHWTVNISCCLKNLFYYNQSVISYLELHWTVYLLHCLRSQLQLSFACIARGIPLQPFQMISRERTANGSLSFQSGATKQIQSQWFSVDRKSLHNTDKNHINLSF